MRYGLVILVLLLATAVTAQQPANPRQQPGATVPTVLFMCPHGAAKSVLASAYFRRVAKERGLNVRVETAGTDPDTEVSSRVSDHLKETGFDVPVAKPRRVDGSGHGGSGCGDFIGCDPTSMPSPRGSLIRWDDVPAPSEDFAAADEKIRERVIQLVDELVRKQRR